MEQTYITEQCGARWVIRREGHGDRAFWVFLVHGRSQAKPGVVGFCAPSVNAACSALNN